MANMWVELVQELTEYAHDIRRSASNADTQAASLLNRAATAIIMLQTSLCAIAGRDPSSIVGFSPEETEAMRAGYRLAAQTALEVMERKLHERG